MQLQSLDLHNFRCYSDLRLELSRGLNVFVGPNASGKTTLLEAVFLLATTTSTRASGVREMVRWDQPWAAANGRFLFADRPPCELRLVLAGESRTGGAPEGLPPGSMRGGKAVVVDGRQVENLRDILGRVELVFFSPDDLQLVKDTPRVRRRFLNTAIGQIIPRYIEDLNRYRRALRQRNELLHGIGDGPHSGADLAPWTRLLAQSGAQIAQDRAEFIAQLRLEAQRYHRQLSDGAEELVVNYLGDLAEPEDLAGRQQLFTERLDETADAERRRGHTLVGPHRDDLDLTVGGASLRRFGSQGQQRTAALSLKLAEAQVMQRRRGDSPVLLLDDCLSELDPRRMRRLLELTGEFDQILLTTATAEAVLTGDPGECQWFEVGEGAVTALSGPPPHRVGGEPVP